MYAFRFATTEEQDDSLIARMNSGANHSHYSLVFWNCADFSRAILNFYFPRTFLRSIVPDAGITTPMQVTYKLVRYAHQHPETQLTVFEIPQVPGYRGPSRANKSIANSLVGCGYVVPLVFINPFIAGGVMADYLAWGRYPLHLKQARTLTPAEMTLLTLPSVTVLAEGSQSGMGPAH